MNIHFQEGKTKSKNKYYFNYIDTLKINKNLDKLNKLKDKLSEWLFIDEPGTETHETIKVVLNIIKEVEEDNSEN